MKLYISTRAPNPRRVLHVHRREGHHRHRTGEHRPGRRRAPQRRFLAKNPLAQVPALELDDGRACCETRAICTYLEGLHPEPNLMGEGLRGARLHRDGTAAASCSCSCASPTACATRIRRWRRWSSRSSAISARRRPTRCGHGALAGWGAGAPALCGGRAVYDCRHHGLLCAGVCARPDAVPAGEEGMEHLQAWRDRIAERPSAAVSRE
jgi:glutathione S-transferase